MINRILIGITLLFASNAYAGPSTQPRDAWHKTEYGDLMLRNFKAAPFPHKSREKGWTNRAGDVFPADRYQDSTIGIVIPKNYKQTDSVDLIVHFHGHHNYVENVLDRYQLPDQLNESGCNAILLVPQGPRDVPDSNFGKMEDAGGFEAMVHEVVEYLKSEGKIKTTKIGRIAITAHSGGYNAVAAIVDRGGMRDKITDVILFDSSYGGLENYADWIKLGGQRRLISLFTAHLASANVELMTLLKKRAVPYDLTLESDLTPEFLFPRKALFIHTLDLAHDDVIDKHKLFTLFLRTSSLSK